MPSLLKVAEWQHLSDSRNPRLLDQLQIVALRAQHIDATLKEQQADMAAPLYAARGAVALVKPSQDGGRRLKPKTSSSS